MVPNFARKHYKTIIESLGVDQQEDIAGRKVILLMGVQGAGKRRFPKRVSQTCVYHLDGLDCGADRQLKREVLDHNAGVLVELYMSSLRVVGIIYLHPINDAGLNWDAYSYCNIFQRLIGPDAFSGIVLVSSMWDAVDTLTAERRHKVMEDTVWAGMIEKGARTARSFGNSQSEEAILKMLEGNTTNLTLAILSEPRDRWASLEWWHPPRDLPSMTERRFARLLDALLEEHALAIEKGEDALAAELKTCINGVRDLIQEFYPTARSGEGPTDANFLYSKLQGGQIRILDLRAGEGDEPVEFVLRVVNLEKTPDYEAVSYVVGTAEPTGLVRIRSKNRVERRNVTQNLQNALKFLRYPLEDRPIWVDALSINQEDVEERSSQVRIMSQIFRTAKSVCIWLGGASEDSGLAMGFIARVMDFAKLDGLVRDEDKRKEWTALARLLARDWFRRRWVVQEMALARQATVNCDAEVVPWSDLKDAAALFGTKRLELMQTKAFSGTYDLGDVHAPGATSLVAISDNIFRKGQNGAIRERRFSIEYLLSILPMFDVTNHLDAFYAIMDLGSDTYHSSEIPVDYQIKPAELFAVVTRVAIKSSNSLDIICRPWAPECALPSWIRTVSEYAYVRNGDTGQYERENADSLVGIPGQGLYSAAGDTRPTDVEITESPISSTDPQIAKILSWKGIQIGKVGQVSNPSQSGTIPANWPSLGGWPQKLGSPPDRLWRTIIADRANGSNPPSWYGKAFNYSFHRQSVSSVNINQLMNICRHSANGQEFLRRLQTTTSNRVLFDMDLRVTQEQSDPTIGLGRVQIRKEDLICILFGCSVPVLLRPHPVNHSWYELIGECFVYGMMEGQAIQGWRAGKYQEETFLLA